MRRTDPFSLLASIASSLLVSVLLVGVSTSVFA